MPRVKPEKKVKAVPALLAIKNLGGGYVKKSEERPKGEYPIGLIVGGKYQLVQHLTTSDFVKCYNAYDILTKERVFVKLEKEREEDFLRLYVEEKVLNSLHHRVKGFQNVRWSGRGGANGEFHVLVLDSLGPNLSDLARVCTNHRGNDGFSIQTVLMVGCRILDQLEILHACDVLHRNISPNYIRIGVGPDHRVLFLTDFGSANKYRNPVDNLHVRIWQTELTSPVGSLLYASINAHLRLEQSRRDDLESLGYMLIDLASSLPWMVFSADKSKEELSDIIMGLKISTPIEKLCDGLPKEFREYLNHVRSLRFDESPDYNFLRKLFAMAILREDPSADGPLYDWEIEKMIQNGKILPKPNASANMLI